MSIWVSLETKVKKGSYEKLVPFLQQNLPKVRGFEGALSVSIFYDKGTENFLIFEEWLSQQHHQNYIKFISENGVMNQLVSFMEGPPEVKYYGKLTI